MATWLANQVKRPAYTTTKQTKPKEKEKTSSAFWQDWKNTNTKRATFSSPPNQSKQRLRKRLTKLAFHKHFLVMSFAFGSFSFFIWHSAFWLTFWLVFACLAQQPLFLQRTQQMQICIRLQRLQICFKDPGSQANAACLTCRNLAPNCNEARVFLTSGCTDAL